MKKIVIGLSIFIVFIFCIVPICTRIFLNHNDRILQEECDSNSTIELFFKSYESETRIPCFKKNSFESEIRKDYNFSILNTIKNVEFTEYYISHNNDQIENKSIQLIYGDLDRNYRNFILFEDLENICVYYIKDKFFFHILFLSIL